MFNRSIKVLTIVCVIAAACFFLFNYYLPSVIGAAGPAVQYRRAQTRVEEPSEKLKTGEPQKKSVADELGVPRPSAITYRPFNPADIKKQKKNIREIFTVPEALRAEFGFWKDVYTKYDKSKVLFHDKEHMDVIYSVLDISDIVNNGRPTDDEKIRRKKARVEAEQDRIAAILKGLEEKDYSSLSREEKRIYHLFDNVREAKKFMTAAGSDRLRSQTGIADKFIEGIKVAGRYLGEIEKIFSEYNIPLEITRLAFVESMFNLEALSKVGASGIWQFMPRTGKLFLTIDQIVDERNDPILATHAAAKLLNRDYEILRSWPLAINAYNTGRIRLERAVARLGTRDIARIIKEFDYPGYGFASRNFYPAFLAALDVFENREEYFGHIEMEEPLTFDIIHTPCFTTLPELSEYTGVPVEKLTLLNPHLQEEAVAGKLPVPKGFLLKVPGGRGEDFLVALNEMDKQTKYAKWHIVGPGENLKTIAAKYRTNIAALKKTNGLRGGRLRPGQILKLPE